MLSIAVGLHGCSDGPPELFRVGTNLWVGYEPFYLARDLGEYQDSGVRLVELPNATDVIQALRNGTIDAAALTLDEAMTIAQDGYELRVVLVLDFSRGGDALLAQPEFKSLEALRGHRIGVEYTAVGAIVLDSSLTLADLGVEDIELVPMTLDGHEGAFENRQVDALVTFEPVRSRLLAAGARELFNSRQIPDRIVDVLVVPADVLESHPAALGQLVRGYFAALEHYRSQNHDAVKRMSRRLRLTSPEVQQAYAGLHQPDLEENRRLLSGNPPPLSETATDLMEFMISRGMLIRPVDVRQMFSEQFLPTAQR